MSVSRSAILMSSMCMNCKCKSIRDVQGITFHKTCKPRNLKLKIDISLVKIQKTNQLPISVGGLKYLCLVNVCLKITLS